MVINTHHTFSTSSYVITYWCQIHTTTFPLILWPPDLREKQNFSPSSRVITSLFLIHTSTLPIPPVITSWSLIHTATFQLFSCYEVLMLNTSRNVTTSWWSRFTATSLHYIFHDISSCRLIHIATFPLSTMLHPHVDQCIRQLFHFLLCYNFMVIITYRNFSTSSYKLTLWSLLHTTTFPLSRTLKLHDHVYLPQLFHFLLCCNFMTLITYRNFSTSSLVISSWWSLHPATFSFPPLL